MKVLVFPIAMLACLAAFMYLQTTNLQRLSAQRLAPTGVIQLTIVTPPCGALSPQHAAELGIDPATLNDDNLDSVERDALAQGCTLQAVAIAPNGMRLTDIPLVLIRIEPGSGIRERFGTPRRTNDYGVATWFFRPTPDTHFLYEVESPNPVRKTARSNEVEIRLCTGARSIGVISDAPRQDIGRGCR